MSSQLIDNHPIPHSPYFSPHFPVSSQRHLGFTKADILTSHYGIKPDVTLDAPCNTPYASLPHVQLDSLPAAKEHINFMLQRHAIGPEKPVTRSLTLCGSMNLSSRTKYNSNLESSWNKSNQLYSHYKNGLFSSSMELFDSNLTSSPNNALPGNFVETTATHNEEDEPFESSKEIEAQTIGNLLSSDDDLLCGVVDGGQHIGHPREENIKDLDFFGSGRGMNLGDGSPFGGERDSKLYGNSNGQWGGTKVSTIGKHPNGEHPSRTLFVRNIDNNVEDSELKALFEQYGDVQTLYTTCKLRGFVMISYYDIRAARNAMQSLKNKSLRHKRLDIHYSIPKDNPSDKDVNLGTLVVFNLDSSVSNDDVHNIFGAYGEIKEIWETPQNSKRIVEFYDVRAADEALRALNWSEIAGKKIHIGPSHLGVAKRSLMLPLHQELGLDEDGFCLPNAELLHDSVKGISVKGDIGMSPNVGIRASTGPLMENSLRHLIYSSVSSSLPSSFGVELTGKQSGLSESDNFSSQLQNDLQALQNRHSHSIPEYSDVVSRNGDDNLSASISSVPSERVEDHLLGRMSFSIDMGFNSSVHANGHLVGHHYGWSNLNQSQPPAFMCPNSPSLTNRFCVPQPQHRLHGLAKSPSHRLNSILPISGPQVGSSPIVNRLIWNGQSYFAKGSPKASSFNYGPVGSMKISDSHMHHVDLPSYNMSPHVGGNCMDIPISFRDVGLHSFQHRSTIHPNRSQMNMGGSLKTHNVQARSRRNDNISSQAGNKKQYELDIDRIRLGEDNRTTLMVKNIPNKYTSKMLMAAIDEHHRGTYDFIYLPIDFKNKCNVGYAFINMVDPSHIVVFYENFNGKKWEKFNSEKVASFAYARIQGKSALITHFQNSSLMNEDKRCRPILFHNESPNAGDQVPFLMGVNVRSRAGRSRSSSNDDNSGENASHTNKYESSSSSCRKEF